jgi:hypothetical protein
MYKKLDGNRVNTRVATSSAFSPFFAFSNKKISFLIENLA